MNLTNEQIKAAEIAVDTIDFIEKKVHEIIKIESNKKIMINSIMKLINSHFEHNTIDGINEFSSAIIANNTLILSKY